MKLGPLLLGLEDESTACLPCLVTGSSGLLGRGVGFLCLDGTQLETGFLGVVSLAVFDKLVALFPGVH